MSDNDNYEEQVELREQEAYNAAMSEAGREADRVQSEHGAYVAELEARIAELEAYIDELENPQSIQDACICEDNPQDDRAGLYIDPDCPVHGEAQDA